MCMVAKGSSVGDCTAGACGNVALTATYDCACGQTKWRAGACDGAAASATGAPKVMPASSITIRVRAVRRDGCARIFGSPCVGEHRSRAPCSRSQVMGPADDLFQQDRAMVLIGTGDRTRET